jgi:1,4-dihydroxy-2-naphthoate octaprenyltransferase
MKLWDMIRLGRPHFLLGGVLLYTYGASLAALSGAEATQESFILGYLVLFFGQLSVSYSNDYFDRGVDGHKKRTLFSGGSGILQKDPSLAGFSKGFALALILLSMTAALISVMFFGFPQSFILLAAVGNLLGWYYTASPLRLSYRGLGELSTMIAAGVIMPAAGYLTASGRLDISFFLSSIPLLFYGLVFILSVEVPDIEEDAAGGKKTWATNIGVDKAFAAIVILSAAATISYLFLPTTVDYTTIIIASLLPVAAGLAALAKKTDKMATCITVSLMAFLLLADLYLLTSATGFYLTHQI